MTLGLQRLLWVNSAHPVCEHKCVRLGINHEQILPIAMCAYENDVVTSLLLAAAAGLHQQFRICNNSPLRCRNLVLSRRDLFFHLCE